MIERREVVITGVGAVTPLGTTWPETWQEMVDGRNGIGAWPFFDAETFPARICGVVPEEGLELSNVSRMEQKRLSRASRFGVRAAKEAMSNAGLSLGEQRDAGVVFGHSVGRPGLEYLSHLESAIAEGHGHEVAVAPNDVISQEPNFALNLIARELGATGPVIGMSTACSASGHAVGEAFRAVQDGDVDLMVTGGFDSLTSWIDLAGFGLLGALTSEYNDQPESASRPFDKDRSGFVLGEGAAALVLESKESATARGARILGIINGFGASLNAYRVTDSPPDGGGAVEAINAAISDAKVTPEEIELIVAHGTSTPGNDKAETRAIHRVFGSHAANVSVTAPKSMLGHLTAASAAVGVLTAIGALNSETIPPTRNLTTIDAECDLDYVPGRARGRNCRNALVNAFAFGGTNTCLSLTRYTERVSS